MPLNGGAAERLLESLDSSDEIELVELKVAEFEPELKVIELGVLELAPTLVVEESASEE